MKDLPVEVMVEILSRLPVKTVIHCKCVCKKWLNIVYDSYFASLHLLRSPAGLIIHHKSEKVMYYSNPGILKWVEVEDELDHHLLHHDPVMNLDLNLTPIFQNYDAHPVGSVNGLICLWQLAYKTDNYYICNPMTREYIILPMRLNYRESLTEIIHGFGFGSLTKEYKVIMSNLIEAEVYTLGTRQWRTLGHVPYLTDKKYGPFLNGHAHWTIANKDSPEKICTFNFDKETFELFPSPPEEDIEESQVHSKTLGVLKGCLCRCDMCDSHFTIWVMKEHGIKTSWHKEFIINKGIIPLLNRPMWYPMYMIERLRDGTILMLYFIDKLLVYSPQRRIIEDT